MSFVPQVIQKDLAVVKDDTGRIVATCVLHGGLRFTSAALAQFAKVCEGATCQPDPVVRQSLEEWAKAQRAQRIDRFADPNDPPFHEFAQARR
jgi:hypothetical protein